MPLIVSLGRKGVPVMYCSGVGEHPSEPLKGVRLVFMDLYVAGVAGAHANIQAAVELLRNVVDLSESGIGLILWTTHSDTDKEAFQSALRERTPHFAPAFIKDQEKLEYTAGNRDFDDLWNDITVRLNEEPAHAILRSWEQAAHDAASQSTELLRRCAGGPAELQKTLGAVAKAGGPINSPDDAVSHLHQGLNTVLMDAVSAESRLHPSDPEHAAQLRLWTDDSAQLSSAISGQINGAILLDQVDHAGITLRPGNVYTVAWNDQAARPCPSVVLYPKDVYEQTGHPCVSDKLDSLQTKRTNVVRNGGDPGALQKIDEQIQTLSGLREQVEYAVVEITPACDFVQGKAPTARFAGGLLVNDSNINMLKVTPTLRSFLRTIGPVHLNRDNQNWHLILNARLVYTRTWPTMSNNWKPLCRMREQLLVDVQHWLASYSSRPGFFSVR